MAESRRHVADLPADRLQRLMERLRENDRAAAPGIAPAPRGGDPPPASFVQERLWLLDQLAGASGVCNLPVALRLRGPLRPSVLAAALREVARRHESLRTTLITVEGRAALAIAAEPSLTLPVIDHTALAPAARESESLRRAAAEARRPFDLARGPLARALLIRLAAEEHLFILVLHHAVADGGSLGILFAELAQIYAAGGRAALRPLPLHYSDFAAWQRRWLAGEALADQLGFWREELVGAPEALDLPTDRPRPAAPTFRGATVAITLPPEQVQALRDLAQGRGATLFMALLAAWSAVLHRWSGADELVIGAPVANRRPEVAGVIGCFVNLLPLRTAPGNRTFAALLAEVRERALAAFAHPDLPFERLVEALPGERDLSRHPLFQVLLTLQDGPAVSLSLPGIAAEPLAVDSASAKLDLTLGLSGSAGGFAGGLEYATDLFDAATARRMAGHLAILLAGAIEGPDRQVADLPLLTAGEERQVLIDWTATAAPFPRGLGLHELFAAQALRTPDATALVWGHERLTYRQLDDRAGQLARRLRRLGVGSEVLVGIYTRRTPDMVAALIAVMRAGGAYVPLDPAYPAERITLLLADTAAPVLITERELVGALPVYEGTVVLLEEAETRDGRDSRNDGELIDPDQTAYTIYTSGSTGLPKAILIRHSSAVAMIEWALATYPAEALGGMLASTSICFDISVFEIFAPLACGGTVILADDALVLADLPAAGEVRLIDTVPSAMAELLRAGAVPASVRIVNLAGEPLRRDLVSQVYELPHVEAVYNLYGPSEDTTFSTVSNPLRGEEREPTIGRPIANCRVYVLDRGLRPVPVGVPGEVWIAGEGLARGYLNRPELTADRFRPDPFAALPGERLYRVGDLARYLPDGELDCLGRLDHQVKIRGFRVELGEIEAALTGHPKVREAVVIAREDGVTRALFACVVPAATEPMDGLAEELRRHLGERLPAYMVPASFRLLAALPLTLNGKIDRKALAKLGPGGRRANTAGPAAVPRTPAEERLARLWAELLDVAAVGVEESFFELGGHSLLAMRMISRLRAELDVELPVRAVFDHPTIAGLAGFLKSSGTAFSPPPLRPLRVAVQGEAPPLSFSQTRLWFLDRLEPGDPSYNIPGALRLHGPVAIPALASALREIARRHAVLRTTFAESGGHPAQIVGREPDLGLPLIDLSSLSADRREALARELARGEGERPFDLARGPLARAALLRLGDEEHAALFTLHHIVADAGSAAVFARELSTLYGSFAAGLPSPLPELPVQYADYAAWQREWLALERRLGFWRERLTPLPAPLELPVDRAGDEPARFRGAVEAIALPPALAGRVERLGAAHGATPFMTVLTAFQILLGRYADRDDFTLGTPVANRGRAELEGLIGFFLNILVLRADLAGHPTAGELLARVRDATLDAYTHQDLPFERLVEELLPARELSRTPLFQVLFTFQSASPPLPDFGPGLAAAFWETGAVTAKFALSLNLSAGPHGWRGALGYDAGRLDRATVQRLAGHLRELLAGLASRPAAYAAELSLMTAEERHQTTLEGSAAELGAARLVHHRFADWARTAPDAAAVVCEARSLSYREVDRRANRLARRLRALGIGAEARVGLCLAPALAVVPAILGILRSGGAYVPLEPDLPADRLAATLADSGARVLVTQGEPAAWAAGSGVSALTLDDEWSALAEESSEPLGEHVGADSLAYVIYTSGSTGTPKGVMVEHRQLAAYVEGVTRRMALAAGASYALVSTVAADLGHTVLFTALATGGTLHVVTRERLLHPERMAELFDRAPVDCMKIVPSHLSALLTARRPAGVLPRWLLVLGGEPSRWSLIDRLRELAPECRVLNHYGPTETTVGVLAFPTWDEGGRLSPRVPLGRPLPGVRVAVADRSLQPLPMGVPGELLVGGPQVCRGYLRRPDLTAERFVPDSLTGLSGARLYRTGDLTRYRGDGSIEFLGRTDLQVKVRGFRVEPGEIEAVLAGAPGVRAAAVLADGGEPAGVRLVAYVVAASLEATAEALRAALRDYLTARLPAAMVPSQLVFLTALPLTPNGKLDRRALARLAPEAPAPGEEFVAPRDPLEEMLAPLWAEVLGIARVGAHDNFFALGGHSLLGIQLLSRMEDLFGVRLPVRALFQSPTLGGMAERIAGELAAQAGEDLLRQLAGEGAAGTGFQESFNG